MGSAKTTTNSASQRTQVKLGSWPEQRERWLEVCANCFSKGYVLSSLLLPGALVILIFAASPATWTMIRSESSIAPFLLTVIISASVTGAFCFCTYALIALLRGLAKSQSQLRDIIHALPIGLAVLNDQDIVQYVNPALAKMLNGEAGSIVGKRFSDVIELPANLQVSKASGPFDGLELFAKRNDGTTVPVVLSISPFNNDRHANRLASIIDVSEKYETQKLKQHLVSIFSHEIRTPLMAIEGFLHLLSQGLVTEPSIIKEKSLRAGNNCRRLLSLISNLIELERLDTGFGEIRLESVCLAAILNESLDSVIELAEQKRIIFDTDAMDISMDIALLIDRERISRLFINLLGNAVKFAPEESAIKVKVSRDSDGLKIEIIDRGPGIDPHLHDRLFKPFQRIDNEQTRRVGGSGLGLAICKQIISEHGGQIGVQSESGCGSNFWIRLPDSVILDAKENSVIA